MAGGRWQVAGGRWQVAGGRWQVAGGRWQLADGRWQMAGGKWQVLLIEEKSSPSLSPDAVTTYQITVSYRACKDSSHEPSKA